MVAAARELGGGAEEEEGIRGETGDVVGGFRLWRDR
jgi:hypothetical protein